MDTELPETKNTKVQVGGEQVSVSQLHTARILEMQARAGEGDSIAAVRAGFYEFLSEHPRLQARWPRAVELARLKWGELDATADYAEKFKEAGLKLFYNAYLTTPVQANADLAKRLFWGAASVTVLCGLTSAAVLRAKTANTALALGCLSALLALGGVIRAYGNWWRKSELARNLAACGEVVPAFEWSPDRLKLPDNLSTQQQVEFAVRWNNAYASSKPGQDKLDTSKGEYGAALARMELAFMFYLSEHPTCPHTFSKYKQVGLHPWGSRQGASERTYKGSVEDFISRGELFHRCALG